jgi:hypothetical protein
VFFSLGKETAHNLKEIHEALGNLLLWLAIFHAAAAVWHHRFVKDDTLTRLTGPIRPDSAQTPRPAGCLHSGLASAQVSLPQGNQHGQPGQ